MKKILLSGFVIVTFIGYAIHQRTDAEAVGVITPNISQAPATLTPTPVVAQGSTPPPAATATPTPIQLAGAFKNGEYTGSVADAYYGNVQVKAVISGGKISDVQFLQYPSDRRTSIMINEQAMPYLKQEAIQAQSANVDGVSGATQTSRAFIESLQTALNQAK
jgi:uncharacterized protein with FMN-binding domain